MPFTPPAAAGGAGLPSCLVVEKITRFGGGFTTLFGLLAVETVPVDPTTNNANAYAAFYVDPARHGDNLVWDIVITTNNNAPGQTLSLALYPITATAGGSNLITAYTLGAAVAGSTVNLGSLAANLHTCITSSEFATPAADLYVMGLTMGGSPSTANSNTALSPQLRGVA